MHKPKTFGRGWADRTMHQGQYALIADLVAAGSHRIEAWGNGKEGWTPHIVSVAQPNAGLAIGPTFWVDMGDRLKDLRAAAGRSYNMDPKAVKLVSHFPTP